MTILYWKGSVLEFRKLTFEQWLAESFANVAVVQAQNKR